MKMHNRIFFILIVSLLISVQNNISAANNDIASNGNVLSDTNINVSEINNIFYDFNISRQISQAGYRLSPGNYYYGNLIITNDTNQTKRFNRIYETVAISIASGRQASDYYIVLNEWFYYSFNVNDGQFIVPDTPVNEFTNSQLFEDSGYLVSDYGYIQSDEYIYIEPGDSVNVYYDFSFSRESGNIAQNMTIYLFYLIYFEDIYTINTSVTNGTIDDSIDRIIVGSDETINYQANEGYQLQSVIVDGEEVSIIEYPNSYTFSNISENHSIEVIFELIPNSENDNDDKDENGESPNIDIPATGNSLFIISVIFGAIAFTLMLKLKRLVKYSFQIRNR